MINVNVVKALQDKRLLHVNVGVQELWFMKSLQQLSLSMPTYLYLRIHTCLFPSSPIYSYLIYLYRFIFTCFMFIQKKCNQYQHCKSCNCCTAAFKRTRTYEVRSQAIPTLSTFTKLHYTTAENSLHMNGTSPYACRNTMNLTNLPIFVWAREIFVFKTLIAIPPTSKQDRKPWYPMVSNGPMDG